jgi:hypothetical protein
VCCCAWTSFAIVFRGHLVFKTNLFPVGSKQGKMGCLIIEQHVPGSAVFHIFHFPFFKGTYLLPWPILRPLQCADWLKIRRRADYSLKRFSQCSYVSFSDLDHRMEDN